VKRVQTAQYTLKCFVYSFRNMADLSVVVQLCPNPAKHNLVVLLCVSCSPNFQILNAV
jgi:hypothetical protein